MTINGQYKHLGRYATQEKAARAYDRGVRKLGKDPSLLNFPDDEGDEDSSSSESSADAHVNKTSSFRGTPCMAHTSSWSMMRARACLGP